MKPILFLFAWCFILMCEIASANALMSRPYQILRLEHFSIEAAGFLQNHTLLIPELESKDWNGRVASNFNFSIFKYGFSRNRVHGEVALQRFQSVGWEYDLGIKIHKQIEFFWHHHSIHSLEVAPSYYVDRATMEVGQHNYPMEDSFVLKFILIDR